MFKFVAIAILIAALIVVLLISYGMMMRSDDLEQEYGKETVGMGRIILPVMTIAVLLMLYLVSR